MITKLCIFGGVTSELNGSSCRSQEQAETTCRRAMTSQYMWGIMDALFGFLCDPESGWARKHISIFTAESGGRNAEC